MRKKPLILGCILATLFTSCSHDYSGPDTPGNKLQVYGTIKQVASRATGTEWEDGDAIGIHDNGMSLNVNVRYNANADGSFTADDQEVWVLGSGITTYMAYHPYSTAVTSENPTISFNAASGDNVDFLWSTANATRENPNVSFLFAHVMTKLDILINDRDLTGQNMTVKLTGIPTEGIFDTTTGEVSASTTTGTITMQGAVGTPVDFILPPAEESAAGQYKVNIVISVNGQSFQGAFNPALQSSTQYNYRIDLAGADEYGNITVKSCTISDWTQSEGGNIMVEETEAENELEIGDFVLADGKIIDRLTKLTDDQKSSVVGVVYYVGNPQPSEMYPTAYGDSYDYLKAEHPTCVNGLALGMVTPGKGAHFLDVELAGGIGLMCGWMMDNTINGIYGSRYQWIDGEVSASKANTAGENNFLGYNNTRLWQEFAKANNITNEADTFAALYQLQSYSEDNPLPASTSGWYIPSLGELKTLVESDGAETPTYAPVAAIAASFEKLGDTAFLQKARYWSSTEGRISSDKAQTMAATFYSSGAYVSKFAPTNNATTGWYHFSFAF